MRQARAVRGATRAVQRYLVSQCDSAKVSLLSNRSRYPASTPVDDESIHVYETGHLVSRISDFIIYSVEAEYIGQVVKEYGPCKSYFDVVIYFEVLNLIVPTFSSYKGRSDSRRTDFGESAREGSVRSALARRCRYHLIALPAWAPHQSGRASVGECIAQRPRSRL